MTFSEHLYQLRMKHHFLQKDVAEAIGVAVQTYQRYEHGDREPPLSTLIALADFYKVSLDDLTCRGQGMGKEHPDNGD